MGLAVVSARTEVERQRERAKRKGVGARRLHKSEARGHQGHRTCSLIEGSSSPETRSGGLFSYHSLTGQSSLMDPHPHTENNTPPFTPISPVPRRHHKQHTSRVPMRSEISEKMVQQDAYYMMHITRP